MTDAIPTGPVTPTGLRAVPLVASNDDIALAVAALIPAGSTIVSVGRLDSRLASALTCEGRQVLASFHDHRIESDAFDRGDFHIGQPIDVLLLTDLTIAEPGSSTREFVDKLVVDSGMVVGVCQNAGFSGNRAAFLLDGDPADRLRRRVAGHNRESVLAIMQSLGCGPVYVEAVEGVWDAAGLPESVLELASTGDDAGAIAFIVLGLSAQVSNCCSASGLSEVLSRKAAEAQARSRSLSVECDSWMSKAGATESKLGEVALEAAAWREVAQVSGRAAADADHRAAVAAARHLELESVSADRAAVAAQEASAFEALEDEYRTLVKDRETVAGRLMQVEAEFVQLESANLDATKRNEELHASLAAVSSAATALDKEQHQRTDASAGAVAHLEEQLDRVRRERVALEAALQLREALLFDTRLDLQNVTGRSDDMERQINLSRAHIDKVEQLLRDVTDERDRNAADAAVQAAVAQEIAARAGYKLLNRTYEALGGVPGAQRVARSLARRFTRG